MTLSIPRPEGLILVKGHPQQGAGTEVFGIWPSGLVRQITPAEYLSWGSPRPDREIPYGQDAEFLQLVAYDRALRA
ncbi:hypothetical protein ACGFZP_05055 [Kitasatospora sp. NPDC048239]|uniref:hypothetical protein n=1 Tax=Kitasatospora sp. NPDC048239 TaxID=3364046 RepID=UPI003717262D